MKRGRKICIAVVIFILAVAAAVIVSVHIDRADKEASEFIYSSGKQAMEKGGSDVLKEWKELNLGDEQASGSSDETGTISSYKDGGDEYFLCYVSTVAGDREFLDCFTARVEEKDGKYAFYRTSAFYTLSSAGKNDSGSGNVYVGSETDLKHGDGKLKFYSVRLGDEKSLYMDDCKIDSSRFVTVKNSGTAVYGVIDKNEHTFSE